MPEMWASTPGTFWTVAERTCRISLASTWECHAGLLASTLWDKSTCLTELLSLNSITGRIQATSSVNASPIRLRQQSNGLTNERKHRYLQYSLEFIFEFLAVVSPNAGARISQIPTESEPRTVSNVLAQELIEAGVHFGHRSSRWNPKMRPYIFGRKNLIHIIDVRETIRGLLRGKKYLKQVAATGSLVLFVGTKRQGQEAIAREANRCGMPYVSDRWLGGTLTNFRTIRNRLARLEELEELLPSDAFHNYSKKMQSSLRREHRKMLRNLGGIRTLSRLPECLIVFDPKKEKNAINEARKMGIATVALIDTDCDPDVVDLPIPGNDDSIRSIELVASRLADAILEGKAEVEEKKQSKDEGASADAKPAKPAPKARGNVTPPSSKPAKT